VSLTEVLMKDRRLVVLRTLSEVQAYSLNEGVLRQALHSIGHFEAGKDIIRADLQFLEQHALIRIEKMPMPSGELWVAHLLDAGLDVANGQAHEGVARRTPGG
jgi:hypothetical protein